MKPIFKGPLPEDVFHAVYVTADFITPKRHHISSPEIPDIL